ncbi:hypothetical protein VNO78_15994 [Psophocarpus tetragonolobus]|uniref:Uncharacterized protein n=1 Tax=Psophocarpus tetragonolobus TaxID=3891 RepID=A0AAN9SGD4_PSOTE
MGVKSATSGFEMNDVVKEIEMGIDTGLVNAARGVNAARVSVSAFTKHPLCFAWRNPDKDGYDNNCAYHIDDNSAK